MSMVAFEDADTATDSIWGVRIEDGGFDSEARVTVAVGGTVGAVASSSSSNASRVSNVGTSPL